MLLVQAIILLTTYFQLAESLKLAETVATLARSFSALRTVPTLSIRILFWDVGQIRTGKLLKKSWARANPQKEEGKDREKRKGME